MVLKKRSKPMSRSNVAIKPIWREKAAAAKPLFDHYPELKNALKLFRGGGTANIIDVKNAGSNSYLLLLNNGIIYDSGRPGLCALTTVGKILLEEFSGA